jgi:hypothetical protein
MAGLAKIAFDGGGCFCSFGIASGSTTQKQVGVHFKQTHGSEILPGLHVIDPPHQEVARGAVDIEQL